MTNQGKVDARPRGASDISIGFLIAAVGAFLLALGLMADLGAFMRFGAGIASAGMGLALLGGWLRFAR